MAKAAERRLPPRSGGLFGGDGLWLLVSPTSPACPSSSERNSGSGSAAIGDVRRRRHFGEPQRLGQPTGALEQALGLLGHLALLEMVDELRGALALRLANGFEDAASW